MKKQSKFMEFLNSKGFYTALFTCLFAVLAIAAFVSIRNIDAITKLTTYGEKDISTDELRPVGVEENTPVSEIIRNQENKGDSNAAKNRATTSPGGTQTAPSIPQQKATSPGKSSMSGQIEQMSEQIREAAEEQAKSDVQKQEANPEIKPESKPEAKQETNPEKKDTKSEQSSSAAEPSGVEIRVTEKATEQAAVVDGDDMNKPLDGEIVMDFSTEHGIYDVTLEQWRTNPTVSIKSEVGTQVKAAASGVVESVSLEPRTGLTLVIDHGNGLKTTYGQLQETVLVKKGDTVKKGQAVGGVGNPNKYGVLLGPHLVFGIIKDDVPQNPNVVMAEE